MPTAIPDLWPDDIAQVNLTPPLSILQDQAQKLTERTSRTVCGVVETLSERAHFIHTLSLIAPALSNYTAKILRVKHSVQFYPLEVITEMDGPDFRAAAQEDFLRTLSEIFASAPLKKLVHSLIAQSRAAGHCEDDVSVRYRAPTPLPVGMET